MGHVCIINEKSFKNDSTWGYIGLLNQQCMQWTEIDKQIYGDDEWGWGSPTKECEEVINLWELMSIGVNRRFKEDDDVGSGW